MTLIFKNITKLFESNYNSLDAKMWVQKVILKKYLKKKIDYHAKLSRKTL